MARLKGWKGSGKTAALKTELSVYINRGALVAASWPKKRGRPKSAITREQNEWFRQANLLAKYATGQDQWMAIEISRGSPWYPRDILISAMAGRLFETLNIDGVEFRSMAVNEDVSNDLDFLAGKVPGTIIVRGQDMWGALVPGPLGSQLTSNGPATLPTYEPNPLGGTRFLTMRMPLTSWGTDAFATLGNLFQPVTPFGVHRIGVRINATINHVYRGAIYELSPTWLLNEIVAETIDIVAPATDRLWLLEPLIVPPTLSPTKIYAICWSRRDGADNFVLPLGKGDPTLPWIGLPQKMYTPLGNAAPFAAIAKAQPSVGDQFSAGGPSGYDLSAEISL